MVHAASIKTLEQVYGLDDKAVIAPQLVDGRSCKALIHPRKRVLFSPRSCISSSEVDQAVHGLESGDASVHLLNRNVADLGFKASEVIGIGSHI